MFTLFKSCCSTTAVQDLPSPPASPVRRQSTPLTFNQMFRSNVSTPIRPSALYRSQTTPTMQPPSSILNPSPPKVQHLDVLTADKLDLPAPDALLAGVFNGRSRAGSVAGDLHECSSKECQGQPTRDWYVPNRYLNWFEFFSNPPVSNVTGYVYKLGVFGWGMYSEHFASPESSVLLNEERDLADRIQTNAVLPFEGLKPSLDRSLLISTAKPAKNDPSPPDPEEPQPRSKINEMPFTCLKDLTRELRKFPKQISLSPQHGSMFIRYDDEEPYYMRACLTGVAGTPYAYGVFTFDLKLPPDYPNRPPKVRHTTKNGGNDVTAPHGPGGISPNLHKEGKVCISLLGTWDGPGWNPKESNVYQVLSTIQLMVLGAEDPYAMEPGFGGWGESVEEGADDDECEEAQEYNYAVRLFTLKHSILGNLREPVPGFEEPIRAHLLLCQQDILTTAIKWIAEAEELGLKSIARGMKETRAALVKEYHKHLSPALQEEHRNHESSSLKELEILLSSNQVLALREIHDMASFDRDLINSNKARVAAFQDALKNLEAMRQYANFTVEEDAALQGESTPPSTKDDDEVALIDAPWFVAMLLGDGEGLESDNGVSATNAAGVVVLEPKDDGVKSIGDAGELNDDADESNDDADESNDDADESNDDADSHSDQSDVNNDDEINAEIVDVGAVEAKDDGVDLSDDAIFYNGKSDDDDTIIDDDNAEEVEEKHEDVGDGYDSECTWCTLDMSLFDDDEEEEDSSNKHQESPCHSKTTAGHGKHVSDKADAAWINGNPVDDHSRPGDAKNADSLEVQSQDGDHLKLAATTA